MITLDDINDFEMKFFRGDFPHQRYGQAFCNTFNIQNQKLFYSEDYRFCRIQAWFYVNLIEESTEEE